MLWKKLVAGLSAGAIVIGSLFTNVSASEVTDDSVDITAVNQTFTLGATEVTVPLYYLRSGDEAGLSCFDSGGITVNGDGKFTYKGVTTNGFAAANVTPGGNKISLSTEELGNIKIPASTTKDDQGRFLLCEAILAVDSSVTTAGDYVVIFHHALIDSMNDVYFTEGDVTCTLTAVERPNPVKTVTVSDGTNTGSVSSKLVDVAGKTLNLTANFDPADPNTNPQVTWTSDKPTIASVAAGVDSNTGVVTFAGLDTVKFTAPTETVTITAKVTQDNAEEVSGTFVITLTCTHPEDKLETLPATEATCTATGLTEGKKCPICQAAVVEQQEVAMKPHDFSVSVKEVLPTCTDKKDGTTGGKACSVCGAKEAGTGEPIKFDVTNEKHHLGTIETVEAVPAKCGVPGKTEGKKCSECGDFLVEPKETPALEHVYELQGKKDPTCTEKGYTGDQVCKLCGDKIEGKEIKMKPHEWGEAVRDENHPTKGTQTCKVCGKVEEVKMNCNHPEKFKYTSIEKKDPTCTEAGYTAEIKCKHCDQVLESSETLKALGHDWGDWAPDGSGKEIRKCKRCETTESRDLGGAEPWYPDPIIPGGDEGPTGGDEDVSGPDEDADGGDDGDDEVIDLDDEEEPDDSDADDSDELDDSDEIDDSDEPDDSDESDDGAYDDGDVDDEEEDASTGAEVSTTTPKADTETVKDTIIAESADDTKTEVTVDATDGAAKMDKTVIEQIKESVKPVVIKLPLGITVTVDPNSVTVSATTKDFDFSIKVETATAPVVEGMKDPSRATRVEPSQKGDFGMTLNVNIPAERISCDVNRAKVYYRSDRGNLWRHNDFSLDGRGGININMRHASEYIITDEDLKVVGDTSVYTENIDAMIPAGGTIADVKELIQEAINTGEVQGVTEDNLNNAINATNDANAAAAAAGAGVGAGAGAVDDVDNFAGGVFVDSGAAPAPTTPADDTAAGAQPAGDTGTGTAGVNPPTGAGMGVAAMVAIPAAAIAIFAISKKKRK